MAAGNTTIQRILDIQVNYSQAIQGLADYNKKLQEAKAYEKELAASRKDGSISEQEYRTRMAATRQEVLMINQSKRLLEKTTRDQITAQRAEEGSLNQLRAKLSEARQAYDALSRSERNGAKGKELQAHINSVTTELKGAEESTMRFSRSVGDYKNAIMSTLGVNNQFAQSLIGVAGSGQGVSGAFTMMGSAAKAFGKTLLTLLTNPVFLAIAGVAAAGMAFKWFYDYNMQIAEATRLTREFTGLAGQDLENLRAEIQATANTYGKEYKEVLEGVDMLMANFHLDSEEAMKVINDGFQAGADLNGDMLQKMQQYGPAFHDAGIEAEQLVALIQQSRSGIFTKEGLDAIRMGSSRIREMSSSTKEALEGIGIDTDEMQAKLRDGTLTTFEALQQVSGKLKELPDDAQEYGEVASAVFGRQGKFAAHEMLEAFDEIDTSLDNLKGTTGEYGELTDQLREKEVELQKEMAGLFGSGSEGFESLTLRAKLYVKDGLIQIVKKLKEWVQWFKNVWNQSKAVRVGLAVLIGLWRVMQKVAQLPIKMILTGLKTIGDVLVQLSNAFQAIKKNIARSFEGLVEIFRGIKNLDPEQVWNGVKQATSGAWDTVKAVTAGMVDSFDAAFGNVKDMAIDFGKDIQGIINDSGAMIDFKFADDAAASASSGGGKGHGGHGGGGGGGNGDGGGGGDHDGGGGGGNKPSSKPTSKPSSRSSSSSGTTKPDKRAEEEKKLADERAKAYEDAEKALQKVVLELMNETYEKRKRKLEMQYDNEQKMLEKKLADAQALYQKDPNMTAAEREKLDKTVQMLKKALEVLPAARKKALDNLEKEEVARQNKLEQEILKATMDNIKKSGELEIQKKYQLQQEQLKLQQEAELAALKKRRETEELTEEQYNRLLKAMQEKHRKETIEAEEKFTQDLNAVRKKRLQNQIAAIKESQAEEEAVRYLARTKEAYGSDEFYEAELRRLKGAKKEELQAEYDSATEMLELLATNGNERLAEIDRQGQLEDETEEEFQARRKEAKQAFLVEMSAKDTEFANQLLDAEHDLAHARQEIENATIEQKLSRLDENQAELLRKEYEAADEQLRFLQERGQLEAQTQEEFDAEIVAAKQEKFEAIKRINEAQVANEEAKVQAMKALTNGLTNMLDELGDENSAFAKASKIITLAQIAIDTGRALASGIASAAAMPFPANIAAIATTVATVLANIATAISTVKSAKFAGGGKVSGPGTGTSDSIPAMLSNGEFVMNARSTALFEPLLTAMNNIGRGVPIQVANSYQPLSSAEMMTESFSEAAREIRPVVSVVDVTDMQNKVEVIQNLDTF